jgi:hypothetical protein
MRKLFIKPESVEKVYRSFTDEQELNQFIERIYGLSDELHFLQVALNRMDAFDDTERIQVIFRIICTFVLFCRFDIELIQQLVSVLDFETSI